MTWIWNSLVFIEIVHFQPKIDHYVTTRLSFPKVSYFDLSVKYFSSYSNLKLEHFLGSHCGLFNEAVRVSVNHLTFYGRVKTFSNRHAFCSSSTVSSPQFCFQVAATHCNSLRLCSNISKPQKCMQLNKYCMIVLRTL